jgi:hypothetical protein
MKIPQVLALLIGVAYSTRIQRDSKMLKTLADTRIGATTD